MAHGSQPSTYISTHSAEVILSDVRPLKLQLQALQSINVLLDEFLYNVLHAASTVEILDKSGRPAVKVHPLTTDQLRAGLLHVLPTTLGKESLLEAEVELRAYWERAGTPPPINSPALDGGKSFHLLWTYELLKLKCEAYSTLNESDEDPEAESRLNERMGDAGGLAPPKATLVAPAALYLTAFIESMCEHILSKVGRVAARDSSRNTATVHDLFVALCEDHTVYSMFKTMKVYGQIESLTTEPPKRNKSFSRDRGAVSRSSSYTHQESSSVSSMPLPRISSDSSSPTQSSPAPPSRSSFDKARSKMFSSSSRTSVDQVETNGHKKSESVLSEETKKTLAAYNASERNHSEDGSLLQEFDALMRSEDTMKVSLTPDRLKTMESLKSRDRARRSRPDVNRQPDFGIPARAANSRPSLRQVDSIVEDDEDAFAPTHTRSASTTTEVSKSLRLAHVVKPRVRASSTTSSVATTTTPRKTFIKSTHIDAMHAPQQRMPKNMGMPMGIDGGPGAGFPTRTRNKQRNRESLDLDDIMGDEVDDEEVAPAPVVKNSSKSPGPRKAANGEPYVSPGTRDLIDFLSGGPPEEPFPPQASVSNSALEGKQKSSGRLQRMMSKLNIGSERERERTLSRVDDKSRRAASASTPASPMPILAVKPVPPRYNTTPTSPPATPGVLPEPVIPSPPATITRSRQGSIARRAAPVWSPDAPSPSLDARMQPSRKMSAPSLRVPGPSTSERPSMPNGHSEVSAVAATTPARSSPRPPPAVVAPPPAVSGWANDDDESPIVTPEPSVRSVNNAAGHPRPARSPVPPSVATTSAPVEAVIPTPAAPVYHSPPDSYLSTNDGKDMRRLLSSATTADECRLIVDIFFARFRTSPVLAGDQVEEQPIGVFEEVEKEVKKEVNGKDKSIEPVVVTDVSAEAEFANPYPSPSLSDKLHHSQSLSDIHRAAATVNLEHSLVELMLGGPHAVAEVPSSPTPRKRRPRKPVPAAVNGVEENGKKEDVGLSSPASRLQAVSPE